MVLLESDLVHLGIAYAANPACAPFAQCGGGGGWGREGRHLKLVDPHAECHLSLHACMGTGIGLCLNMLIRILSCYGA